MCTILLSVTWYPTITPQISQSGTLTCKWCTQEVSAEYGVCKLHYWSKKTCELFILFFESYDHARINGQHVCVGLTLHYLSLCFFYLLHPQCRRCQSRRRYLFAIRASLSIRYLYCHLFPRLSRDKTFMSPSWAFLLLILISSNLFVFVTYARVGPHKISVVLAQSLVPTQIVSTQSLSSPIIVHFLIL
jgi:hypothetical protein